MVKLREDLIKAEQIKLQEMINEINNSTITKASNEIAQEISEPIFKIIKTADTFKQFSDQEANVKKSNVGTTKKEAKIVKKSKAGRPIKKEAKVKKSKAGRPFKKEAVVVVKKSKAGRPTKKEAEVVKKSKVGRPAKKLFQAVTNK